MEVPVSHPQTGRMENHRRIRQQMRMGLRPGILCFGAMCVLTASENLPPASSTAACVRRVQTNGPRVLIYAHADTTMPRSVLGRAELICAGLGHQR